MFKAFKSKLDTTDNDATSAPEDEPSSPGGQQDERVEGQGGDADDEAALCDLHFIINCQSCSNWTNQDEEDDEAGGWLSHTLTSPRTVWGRTWNGRGKTRRSWLWWILEKRPESLGLKGQQVTRTLAQGMV